MSTPEQISANRANSQNSTGPKTEEGKAASSQNSWKHGLTVGVFRVLATESQFHYDLLRQELLAEHNPTTTTEAILVERMAQHHWMRTRAVHYQTACLESEDGLDTARLNLFMRYESTQERAFHTCLADLLKLRAEKQKAEIGFASHTRKQEMHAFDLLFRQAEIDHQQVRMSSVKCDIYCQERRLEAALERENRAEQAHIERENREEQAKQAA
jgi:hypothetical protein